MAKFQYQHKGYEYEIEADDEKSADEKFNKALQEFNKSEIAAKTQKEDVQNKQWDEQLQKAQTPWEKTDAALTGIFGRANRALRAAPLGLDTMEKKISPSLVKGVPIAGRYVPQTKELSQFEEEHPYLSKGLNIAGGTAATLPIGGGAARLMGEGFGGGGVINNYAGQVGASMPINILDTLAEKGKNTTGHDISKDIIWSLLSSTIPAGVTSIAGQTARRSTAELGEFMKPGGHRFPSGGYRPSPYSVRTEMPGTAIAGSHPHLSDSLATLLGGAAGYHLGGTAGHGIEGLIAGSLLGAPASHVAGQVLQSPTTQDILRALALQSKYQGSNKEDFISRLTDSFSPSSDSQQ